MYVFRPRLWMSILFLLLFAGLIALGTWQLDRAANKERIRDAMSNRALASPVQIGGQVLSPEEHRFRRARVSGTYLTDRMFFVDNRVMDGVAGYHMIVPLQVNEGDSVAVLVNRGWVSWGETRQHLPQVDIPRHSVTISGRLSQPPEDYFSLEGAEDVTQFVQVWQNLDLGRFQRLTGLPVQPLVLELDSDDPDDPAPGLVQRWSNPDNAWIQRHRGYALQWFSLAAVLLVLFVFLNLRKKVEA